jgi:hypothetical protein
MNRFHTLLALTFVEACAVRAQHDVGAHEAMRHVTRDSIGVMGTLLSTTSSPALFGRSRTELLVTQPMLMWRNARASSLLQFAGMLNAERWTMPNGEPVAGIWGEGFIDRRHPHTVLHEVMLTGSRRLGAVRLSLSSGKGIVPFGTDDPMVRPFTKYPANHHLSQILERIQIVTAARVAETFSIEAALFNGDEPTSPTASPVWRRFADSRAIRVTAWAVPQLELQGSVAAVRSPEFASGEGLDQRKASASARYTPPSRLLRYAMVEWAQTTERYRDRTIVAYGSGLIELLAQRADLTAALRVEQTTRPEEERLLDQFRTARPASDLTIRGLTRWRLVTFQVAHRLPRVYQSHSSLFFEATHATSSPQLLPVLLDPSDVIGSRSAWHLTVGARIGIGRMAARVGRYGGAAGGAATDAMIGMMHDH